MIIIIIIISSSYHHHIIIGIIISIILCKKKILGTQDGNKKKNYNIGRFPGGGLENQNPARTIVHSPPGVKETLNYMLREKNQTLSLAQWWPEPTLSNLLFHRFSK